MNPTLSSMGKTAPKEIPAERADDQPEHDQDVDYPASAPSALTSPIPDLLPTSPVLSQAARRTLISDE